MTQIDQLRDIHPNTPVVAAILELDERLRKVEEFLERTTEVESTEDYDLSIEKVEVRGGEPEHCEGEG
jgi:DNA polymerase II large subunit